METKKDETVTEKATEINNLIYKMLLRQINLILARARLSRFREMPLTCPLTFVYELCIVQK